MINLDCKTLAPIWETLASDFVNEKSVVIAKVDAEAENSKATAKDQGVASYPTIKFFPKGSTTPVDYNGGRTEEDFVKYINEKAGTHRTVGGGLDTLAGTIEALDAIVAKFTGGATLSEIAVEASKIASGLKETAQSKYAEYYMKVLDKASKSDTYAAKELKRLDGILKRGGLAPEKLDEFISKTNILRKFVDKVTGKDEL
jgi:protein disulfide-isomerase A6